MNLAAWDYIELRLMVKVKDFLIFVQSYYVLDIIFPTDLLAQKVSYSGTDALLHCFETMEKCQNCHCISCYDKVKHEIHTSNIFCIVFCSP